MDGLSAAASGIAVVSLAIQLVDSIRGIQRFLRSIADAPEELSRLIELLEQLELILEGVGKLVENQRTQQGRLDIDVSPSILKAVQTCQKTLTKLEGLIAKVKQASEAQNRAARSFGRFRLACKKEDVEEFEVQLHRAVSNLNLAMTMNLSAFHSDGHRLLIGGISAMTQEFAILRTEVVTNCSIPRNEQSPSNRNQRSKYPSSRYPTSSKVLYRGVLGTITAIVYSRSEKSDNKDPYHHSDARDQTTYLIIPSFLSQCIQLQCKSSFRFVERTVRTFPVLPDDHAVWNLCREGAVTDIQRLFSNREISPYSVSSWGRSLLHEAAYHYATEVCALLLREGVEVNVVDGYGDHIFGSYFNGSEGQTKAEKTYRLLASVDQDMDFSEFQCDYFDNFGSYARVEEFDFQVQQWVTEDNINLFTPSPLAIVTERLHDLNIDQAEVHLWENIGSYLISKGASIYGHWLLSHIFRGSLLDIALDVARGPFESEAVGARFLHMLRALKVDILEFLRIAQQHHFACKRASNVQLLTEYGDPYDPHFHHNYHNRQDRILQISDTEPFSLSWDWWVDPEGCAYEALCEFRHFGPPNQCVCHDYYSPETLHNWPYIYPCWIYPLQRLEHGLSLLGKREAIMKLFHQRSERRWQKKMTKKAKINGTYRKPKMPGTWID